MGYNTAQELAEILDLESSLKFHLTANHYRSEEHTSELQSH